MTLKDIFTGKVKKINECLNYQAIPYARIPNDSFNQSCAKQLSTQGYALMYSLFDHDPLSKNHWKRLDQERGKQIILLGVLYFYYEFLLTGYFEENSVGIEESEVLKTIREIKECSDNIFNNYSHEFKETIKTTGNLPLTCSRFYCEILDLPASEGLVLIPLLENLSLSLLESFLKRIQGAG